MTALSQSHNKTNPIIISEVSSISSQSHNKTNPITISEVSSISKDSVGLKRKLESLILEKESLMQENELQRNKILALEEELKDNHQYETSLSYKKRNGNLTKELNQYKKSHLQNKTPHTSSTDHTDYSTSASHSSTFDHFYNDHYSATGDNYVGTNLIMANVDFTKIKNSFSSIDEHEPLLRLLLKVYDKGYIHLNCKEALKKSSLLQEGRFGNCGLYTSDNISFDESGCADIFLSLEEIVNSEAVTDVNKLGQLYIILGKVENQDKNLFIVLVPVADPNEMKNSVFLMQTHYRNKSGKKCNYHRKLADSVKSIAGMRLANGVTLFNTFVAKGNDLPTGNYTTELYNLKLSQSWSIHWGRETAEIYRQPKDKHSAFSIMLPTKALSDQFSYGGSLVPAKYLSRSGLNDRQKDLFIKHQFASNLPARIKYHFDGNLRQESIVCQG